MKSKPCIWKNNKQCAEYLNEVAVIIKYWHHLHSGQLFPFRKQLPAMFLFSITLSRSPLFGEGLTLRLMSGKKYQSHAEMP